MGLYFNHWHDYLRLLVAVVCFISTTLLMKKYIQRRHCWNEKTTDYWYALTAWSVAGCVIGIEGIFRDSEFQIRTVLVTVAALVSLNGLRRQGGWGDDQK